MASVSPYTRSRRSFVLLELLLIAALLTGCDGKTKGKKSNKAPTPVSVRDAVPPPIRDVPLVEAPDAMDHVVVVSYPEDAPIPQEQLQRQEQLTKEVDRLHEEVRELEAELKQRQQGMKPKEFNKWKNSRRRVPIKLPRRTRRDR